MTTADTDTISPATTERVLEALGFTRRPDPDLAGLGALYHAWCARVPFDNVRKLIALAREDPGPLPGDTAEDFFAAWLAHGTGGTCWPSANALHSLVAAVGFTSRRVAASMWETGEPTHGTTVVTIEGADHLVDSSMLTDTPLPLLADATTAIEDPVFGATAEPVAEGWRFAFSLSFAPSTIPCRTMSPGAVDHPFFRQRYEVARSVSPFNGHVTARRNHEGTVRTLGGGSRFVRSAEGIDEQALTAEETGASLVTEYSMSEPIVTTLLEVWRPPT